MTKTIKIPLYFEKLKIVIVEVLDNPEYEAYVKFEKKTMVVYVQPTASPSVVAHEAVHIANYVFIRCGIMPDLENDEPQAYLVGWIVNQISTILVKAKESTGKPNP